MLFLSSRNSSACSATTSFKSCASRLSCLTSSVVAARTVSPASRRLPAWQGVYFLEFGTEGGPICQYRLWAMCYPHATLLPKLGNCMITVPGLAAEALGSFLTMHMGRRFGATHANLIALISSAARLALECIGNSDALYHDVEHTMLVTLVGYDIMKGRSLLKPTSASDYAHLIVACLFHDIGFVRGIIIGDSEDGYVIDANGGHVKLSRGSSDAALMPYHVERSKLFVMERIGNSQLLDARRISDAIEFTRFPITEPVHQDNEEGSLARAASLIGQLGDPHYLRKANALFYEFEEIGVNKQLGYASPADLTDLYPKFYFNSISPHLQTAIRYLNVTSSGRQWIAGLHSNVFRAERELNLAGSG